MNIGSISQSALQGINNGLKQASEASQQLASSDQLNGERSDKDTVKNLMDLKQAENQVKISARVAQTAGDVIGSIINIRA